MKAVSHQHLSEVLRVFGVAARFDRRLELPLYQTSAPKPVKNRDETWHQMGSLTVHTVTGLEEMLDLCGSGALPARTRKHG
jgi:hypothetical protein